MKTIFISGGIGDVYVLDGRWTDEERTAIQTIHWATRAGRPMIDLFQQIPHYQAITHIDWWDYTQTKLNCYLHLDQFRQITNIQLGTHVVDRSFWIEFPRFLREDTPFRGSSFLAHKIADRPPALPDRYHLIQPSTHQPLDKAHCHWRSYTGRDWIDTLEWLDRHQVKGVVVNGRPEPNLPDHPDLVDFSGQTTLAQSIEILKGAEGFCGIDSCLSVLACELFDVEHLKVITRNTGYVQHLKLYGAPHTTWPFVLMR